MNPEIFLDHKRIKKDVDMTDGGYQFGKTKSHARETQEKFALAEMEKDCDIQAERPHWQNSWETKVLRLEATIDKQAEQIKTKDEALKKYGQHDRECKYSTLWAAAQFCKKDAPICDCGLEQALKTEITNKKETENENTINNPADNDNPSTYPGNSGLGGPDSDHV